jgi:hypothetical protein
MNTPDRQSISAGGNEHRWEKRKLFAVLARLVRTKKVLMSVRKQKWSNLWKFAD